MEENKQKQFHFYEPIVQMGTYNRFFVRLALGVSMLVFAVGMVIFLASPVEFLQWTGFLFLLFFIDKLLHNNQANKSISHINLEEDINTAQYLTPKTMRYIISAHDKTLLLKGNYFLNLALKLVDNSGVEEALIRLDVSPEEFKDKLLKHIKKSDKKDNEKIIAEKIEKITAIAVYRAAQNNNDFVGPVDLFSAISSSGDKDIDKILGLFDIGPDDLEKAIIFGRFKAPNFLRRIPRTVGGFASRKRRKRIINRSWTSRPTPIFNRYNTDYTELARSGRVGFMIGHKKAYERVLNILSRPNKPNALLIGEAGVGMSKIIEQLAYKINKDKVPRELFDKRLVALDLGKLLAGADSAELQLRVRRVFDEINRAGNIILAIPELHNLTKTAGDKEINLSDVITPLINSNNFPIIATTYPKEHKQYIESDSSFANAFDVVKVEEVTHDEAKAILIYEALVLEPKYNIKITLQAIKKAVQLASRYFHDTPLPRSASSLIKEALSYASRNEEKIVGGEEIVAVAEVRSNIPIKRAGKDEAEKLLNFEEIIHKQLVDQESAVKLVSESLREYRAGLSRKGGPIGTYLFIGPTGVGKTELSKILAKLQFGSEEAMIRFDMSEYQDKTSVFQFVGSPDGSMAGLLTDRVIQKPYSLILLDEFEKAHPDILNIFLQVFDDGRLTDNFGRVVSFENTIIIATSNANSEFIKEQIEAGRSTDDISVELKKKLSTYFRPELLNRFSGVVVFRNLRKEDILKITEMQINELAISVKDSHNLFLKFSSDAIEKIAELGYDPVYGARPLRQTISEKVKAPLSRIILSDDISRGDTIMVELAEEEINLKKSSPDN